MTGGMSRRLRRSAVEHETAAALAARQREGRVALAGAKGRTRITQKAEFLIGPWT